MESLCTSQILVEKVFRFIKIHLQLQPNQLHQMVQPSLTMSELYNFVLKFTIMVHNGIRKLVANFGNFKQTSETVRQKCCETHCKSKQSFGFAVFLLAIGTALNLSVLISFNPSIFLCLRASCWVCLPCE